LGGAILRGALGSAALAAMLALLLLFGALDCLLAMASNIAGAILAFFFSSFLGTIG
jgi:hypothetical protein